MRIYYDWEFIDNGDSITPISIGMIKEDGEKYYAINNLGHLGMNDKIWTYNEVDFLMYDECEWVYDNVFSKLPVIKKSIPYGPDSCKFVAMGFCWDYNDPDRKNVKSISTIRDEVKEFLGESPELWAYYGAYDHVTLAQLWGPMSDLPKGIPYLTLDLQQEIIRVKKFVDPKVNFNLPNIPESNKHHALVDAMLVKTQHEWLKETYGEYFVL